MPVFFFTLTTFKKQQVEPKNGFPTIKVEATENGMEIKVT